ncbi:hypothetical protein CAPN004_03060 [Capnocytophaga cynodegmi]|nr:hypothetical protein CAPN004_03060 [Capnocytophaga cynodegmi]GIM54790.1 hypothetical protein CAPN005_14370 [Capnocytophaga cynodegmi]
MFAKVTPAKPAPTMIKSNIYKLIKLYAKIIYISTIKNCFKTITCFKTVI